MAHEPPKPAEPYVGPRPFERYHSDRFFGRTREANELLSLIIAHRAVLVFAPSGAGKTSLINAGLIPLLEEEGFEIMPLARVRDLLPGSVDASAVANIFVFNTLMSWAEPPLDPADLVHVTVADFLAARPHPNDELGLPAPRVAVFDQFEELFAAHAERWQDREDFFAQVAMALERDPLLRVVLSLREDYLGQLDSYAGRLPERLQGRYRLARLGKTAALAAVVQPLAGTGRTFAPGVAETLVNELMQVRVENAAGETMVVTGEYVEPVQLQVVCQSLWRGLPAEAQVITADHLQAFGDVDQALLGFYERSIRQAVRNSDVQEGDVRTWFEQNLITPAGTRGTVYRGLHETGGLANAVVDALEDLHLIRGEWRAGARWYELTHDRFVGPILKSNEAWLGERREAERARRWLEAKAGEWVALGRGRGGLLDEVELLDAERWLGVLARAGLSIPPDADALVTASRVAVLEAQQAQEATQRRELEQARALAEEQRRRAEAERQRAEAQAAAARRLRVLAAALAVVLLLALLTAWFASSQQRQATRSAQTAQTREAEAIAAKATAQAEVVMRSTAEANAVRNEQTAATRAAEVVAAQQAVEAQRSAAERQQRISEAGRIASAAAGALLTDPQRALSLARMAITTTLDADGVAPKEALDVLHQAVAASRVRMNLAGPRYALWAIAISPDGSRVATSGQDNTVRLWDAATGQPLQTLSGVYGALDLAFSPDGAQLATASSDGSVLLWNLALGTASPPLAGHDDSVWRVAFSPDGERLATTSLDGTARLWDPRTGEVVHTLEGHSGAARGLAFSADGQRLATGDEGGVVHLWQVESGRLLGETKAHDDWIIDLEFSHDGRRLVSASRDGTARVWAALEQPAGALQELAVLSSGGDTVIQAAFSADDDLVFTSSFDGAVRGWYLPRELNRSGRLESKEVFRLTQNDSTVWGLAISPDGSHLGLVRANGKAQLWRLPPVAVPAAPVDLDMPPRGKPELDLAGHQVQLSSVAFSADGTRMAAGANSGEVVIWDTAFGGTQQTLAAHSSLGVTDVAFSSAGSLLATAGYDGNVKVWDVATGEELLTLQGHEKAAQAVAFSPDGSRLATAGDDGVVKVWDATTGAEQLALQAPEGVQLRDAAFTPDGNRVAAAGSDSLVWLWDLDSGDPVRTFSGHDDAINALAFNADGSRLATGSQDNTAIVWDVATGERLTTLRGHTNSIFDVDFFGDRVATGSADRTARVWDADSGRELMALAGHEAAIEGVAFTPDGARVATGSWDGTARVWDAGPAAELFTVSGQSASPFALALDATGRRLAFGGSDGQVTVVDARSGERLRRIAVDDFYWVRDVAFGPEVDDSRLVAATNDGIVRIFDLSTGQTLLRLSGHSDAVVRARFSADGEKIITFGVDGTARIWDGRTGGELLKIAQDRGPMLGGGLSADGSQLVAGIQAEATGQILIRLWDARSGQELPLPACPGLDDALAASLDDDQTVLVLGRSDGTVDFCDLPSGQVRRTIETGLDKVETTALAPNGSLLLVADGQTAALWDMAAGEQRWSVNAHTGQILSAAFDQNATRLATLGTEGTVKLWDLATGDELATVRAEAAPVRGLALSPDGALLAAAGEGHGVRVWSTLSGEELTFLPWQPETMRDVVYSPDGRRIAAASDTGAVHLWDAESGEGVVLDHGGAGVNALAFRPDAAQLATGDTQGVVRLWDVDSGELMSQFETDLGTLFSVAYSSDGQSLALAGGLTTAEVRDATTGAVQHVLQGHDERVFGVAYSPDGERMVTASEDETAKIWDARSGAELLTLRGHTDTVWKAVFSPDGQRVATAGYDKLVKVWDAATGEDLLTLTGPTARVTGVAFSPDGRRLFSASQDGLVRAYALDLEELLRLASQRTVRPLTLDECQRFLLQSRCPAEKATLEQTLALPRDQQPVGAWISFVVLGSAAERAGLWKDDLITAFDGEPVGGDRPLQDLLAQHKPGDVVELSYRRGSITRTTTVKLSRNPTDPQMPLLGVIYTLLPLAAE